MGVTRSGWVVLAAAMALGGCGSDTPTEPSLFRAEDIVVGEGAPAAAGDIIVRDPGVGLLVARPRLAFPGGPRR